MNGQDLPHHQNEWEQPELIPIPNKTPPVDPKLTLVRALFSDLGVVLNNLAQSPEKARALTDLSKAEISGLAAVAIDINRKN